MGACFFFVPHMLRRTVPQVMVKQSFEIILDSSMSISADHENNKINPQKRFSISLVVLI
ncbi:hypothetical protein PAECIP112173_02718 [Paenibacillus sp. JJ-100]|nr:hypothetical protein PAECIP112173_02718 [Paenibacillus sp. JJ-100]